MKKLLCIAVGVLAMIGMLVDSADAQRRRGGGGAYPHVVIGPFDLGDVRLVKAGIIAGGGMTGAYFAIYKNRTLRVPGDSGSWGAGAFALTTVGCATLSPMIAAAIVWRTEQRHLTSREALGLGANCVVPFIGGLIVDAAYDAHPEWK